jgi:hypothetical protein
MNTKTTPMDFFLHLGATIVLYAAAIALINLSFAAINYAIPDALAGYYSSNSIAWPISMLVVLVPLLYVLEWFIHRDYTRMPEKMNLWLRRWRIHLTLFLAGATIVGDVIALINTYLSGELTMRFFYKILAILVICGVIFAYYLLDRRDPTEAGKKPRRILAGVGLVVVLAAIIGGFAIVGSPGKQRDIRFDNQRLNDLSNIQGQLINYWMTKGELPEDVELINDGLYGTVLPVDPETKAPYEYTKTTPTSFELCANFALGTQDIKGRGEFGGGYYGGFGMDIAYPSSRYYPGIPENDNWKHEAGRACFDRTIDPERYPVNPKPTTTITR